MIRIKVMVEKNINEYIKFHANSDKEKEIYGWLIGFRENNTIKIINIHTCHKYIIQNPIRAQPDPIEISILNMILPIGLQIYGIYHSHINDVFLSETDKSTFKDLLQNNKNLISVVSNGEITKYYCYRENKIVEFTPDIFEKNIKLKELTIHFNQKNKKNDIFTYARSIIDNLEHKSDLYYETNIKESRIKKLISKNNENHTLKLQILDNISDYENTLKIKLYGLISQYYDKLNFNETNYSKIFNLEIINHYQDLINKQHEISLAYDKNLS